MRRTTTHAMRRTTLLIAAMVAAVLLASGAAFSQSAPAGDGDSSSVSQGLCQGKPRTSAPDLPVMTRNLYLGADLDPVVAAARTGNPNAVIAAVSEAWATIVGTDFPARANALADEIKESKPMLVGLQEVSLYRTGPPDNFTSAPTPAEEVKYDYLKILLGELNDRGLHYAPVVVSQNYDAEFPGDADPEVPEPVLEPGDIRDIRLTDRDVILARTDLPKTELKLSNMQKANFATNASFPIGNTGQSFTLYRGWGSVDAKVEDGTFRFINTHLEPESTNPAVNEIQVAQGNEILSGPANTNLPVILAGDFNSQAGGGGTDTYNNLINAGFSDAWSVTHPGEPGNTFGHDEDLRNEEANLTQRLDLVLFRDGRSEDGLCAVGADVVGDDALNDRTPSTTDSEVLLWPSDHAGVVATLRVE
jgi:Endonuclease/Exonuclease/phosphatase family